MSPSMSSPTRDRDASRPRRHTTKSQAHVQLSSSASRPNSKGKKTRAKETSEPLYATKSQAVLAEKKERGKVLLLVNWADDPQTGEKYNPSWEPREYILPAGLTQWEEQKRQGLVVKRGGELILHNPSNTPSNDNDNEPETTQGTNKRKRGAEIDSSQDQPQPETPSPTAGHAKKPRRVGSLASSVTTGSQIGRNSLSEVKDSYEYTTPLPIASAVVGNVSVEVGVPVGFDRTDYQTPYVVESSQSQAVDVDSSDSSTPHSSRNLGASTGSLGSTADAYPKDPRPPARGAKDFVIPDSQDEGASEPYEPSHLSHQNTEASTQGTHFASSTEADRSGDFYGTHVNGLDSLENGLEVSLNTHELSNLDADLSTLTSPSQSLEIGRIYNIDPANESYRQIGEPSSQLEASLPSNASEPFTSQSSRLLTPVREDRTFRADSDYPSSHSDLSSIQQHPARLSSYGISPSHLPSPSIEKGSSTLASPARAASPQSAITQASQDSELTQLTQAHSQSPEFVRSSNVSTSDRDPLFSPSHRNPKEPPRSVPCKEQTLQVHSATETITSVTKQQTPLQDRQPSLNQTSQSQSPQQPLSIYPSLSHAPDIPFASIEAGVKQFKGHIPDQRQTVSVTSSSTSPIMDEEEKAAKRAARRAAIEQKLKDDHDKGVAEFRANNPALYASTPSPAPLNSQSQTTSALNNPRSPSILEDDLSSTHIAPPEGRQDEASVEPSEADDNEPISEIEQLELDDANPLDVVAQTKNEHFLPLPLNAICRDIYSQIIISARKERQAFLEDESFDNELLLKINTMFSELDALCNHSDLHSNDYATQREDPVAIQARYAENRSTKCIFVAEIIQAMCTHEKHIAIVVRPGRMLEILEAVLQYHNFVKQSQVDYLEYRYKDMADALKVSLIHSGPSRFQYNPADLVIAFDSTFTTESYPAALRLSMGSPSPLVHLIVANSIEHLERLFSHDIDAVERRVRIVGCLSIIKDDVGKVETDPGQLAADIAQFVLNGADSSDWPCRRLPIIQSVQEYATEPISTTAATVPSQTLVAASGNTPTSTTPISGVTKRLLDDEIGMDVDSPKRLRLTPVPGEKDGHLQNLPSSITVSTDPGVVSSKDSLPLGDFEVHTSNESSSTSLENGRRRELTVAELRRLNDSLQAQVDDLRGSYATFTRKYQEAITDCAKSEGQAAKALLEAQKAQARAVSQQEEIKRLKEENFKQAEELKVALDALKNSTVPELAAVGILQEKVKSLEIEKEKWERQKQNNANDIEYMRTNYQTASSLAAEHAAANSKLRDQNKRLSEQASANFVKIHEIQRDQEKAAYIRMIKTLKLEKDELERELERKSNELAAAASGRRGTRGQSTPMSPRVLSPMGAANTASNSFVPPRGNIGRVIQQNRSRGSSPAVVERATVAGPQVFGELLPGSRIVESRRG